MLKSSRGRPRGGSDARQRILLAARKLFAEHDYHDATMRAIAAEARVDVALLNYYFGSKHGLFAAALAAEFDPAAQMDRLLTGPERELPERIARTVLDLYEELPDPSRLRSVVAATLAEENGAGAVIGYLDRELLDRLYSRLPGPGARERAAAAVSLIAGTVLMRSLLRVPGAAEADRVGLQRLLTQMLRVALTSPQRRGIGRGAR